VPKHTDDSPWSVGYELSTKRLGFANFLRISCAVNFSIRTIAPPQCGHNQERRNFVSPVWCREALMQDGLQQPLAEWQ